MLLEIVFNGRSQLSDFSVNSVGNEIDSLEFSEEPGGDSLSKT